MFNAGRRSENHLKLIKYLFKHRCEMRVTVNNLVCKIWIKNIAR